jgi:hypothetical protein
MLPAEQSKVLNCIRPTERQGNAVVVFETTVRATAIPIFVNVGATPRTIPQIHGMPNRRSDRMALNWIDCLKRVFETKPNLHLACFTIALDWLMGLQGVTPTGAGRKSVRELPSCASIPKCQKQNRRRHREDREVRRPSAHDACTVPEAAEPRKTERRERGPDLAHAFPRPPFHFGPFTSD